MARERNHLLELSVYGFILLVVLCLVVQSVPTKQPDPREEHEPREGVTCREVVNGAWIEIRCDWPLKSE